MNANFWQKIEEVIKDASLQISIVESEINKLNQEIARLKE